MSFAWMRYEVRILGFGANLGPILAIAGCGLIAVLMAVGGAPEEQIARSFGASLEMGIPLVSGILAASIISSDQAVELQRTLQTHYRTTLLRRLGLLASWTAILTAITSLILTVADYWVVPGSLLVSQLSWFAPLLWFIGAGILLAALLPSWSAAAALLAGIWLLQNVSEDWFLSREWARPLFLFMTTHEGNAADWTSTRLVVAATGIILGGIGLIIATRSERITTGGDQ